MMRYFASVLFLATGFLAGQGPMAELVLTVVAPDGSPVESEGELIGPGAAVRRWVAGANGVSRVPEVAMGRYRVIVTAKGFAPGQAEVTVSGPGRLEQRIALELAPIQNSVVVRTLPQNLDGVPGSTAEVTTEELAALRPVSIKEAIRRMAGFHIVDEDAMGLNLNIGLRGLNPRRSQRTMLLEDGAPIHLAP
jgi:hypothetical protein